MVLFHPFTDSSCLRRVAGVRFLWICIGGDINHLSFLQNLTPARTSLITYSTEAKYVIFK